ncbi:hypothetical protein WMY93_009558 [Mugilogobius chulae]|uniref:J domain-containing protein n=1 Tax=Mugilogobius chulae TaxID=88201 RepID=A0AAW0PD76_9GOBI
MGSDYYEILEINRNASDADIKKAYRRLALKFHPARNREPGTYEKFRQLGEAFDVLSDLRKKATYDKFGEDGLKAGIPNEFAKGGAWSSKYDYHDNPEKTFKEFFGSNNPFQVMNDNGCTSSIRDKMLTVTVKPGWKEGTRITFPEEGDQGPNNIAADMVFIVRQKPHSLFKRALVGFVVEVETLDGRIINIPVNEIVHPSYKKVVPGEGMPLLHNQSQRGDLILTFNIHFPEKLSKESKHLIKQALRY